MPLMSKDVIYTVMTYMNFYVLKLGHALISYWCFVFGMIRSYLLFSGYGDTLKEIDKTVKSMISLLPKVSEDDVNIENRSSFYIILEIDISYFFAICINLELCRLN